MISPEIRDELVTCGCANCAVKHLSSALALNAIDSVPRTDGDVFTDSLRYAARAVVNAVEYLEGYESHYDFAVGLLELAEESSCAEGDPDGAKRLRGMRIRLMSSPAEDNVVQFLQGAWDARLLAQAHIDEAVRELPSDTEFHDMASGCLVSGNKLECSDAIRGCIAFVRKRYFPSENEEEKGGEEAMATKKACAKKSAGRVKAVKAACKGGKAKKGCCK